VPRARLGLATLLQAYTRVSDDEVIEATVTDRRWQLVLDCLSAEDPPFAKGTLVGFRKRLIEKNLDRVLVERSVLLAAATKGFGARALRAALDSSPLWGAGRVEDTVNLMGHALRKALGVMAELQGRGPGAGVGRRVGRGGGAGRSAAAGGLQPEGRAGPGLGRSGRPRCGRGSGAGPAGSGGSVRGRPGRW